MQRISRNAGPGGLQAASLHHTPPLQRGGGRLLNLSIRARLVSLLAVALLPIILVQAGTLYAGVQAVQAAEQEADLQAARALAAAVDAFVQDVLHAELAAGSALASPSSVPDASQWLAGLAREYPLIVQLCWLSPDGALLASSAPKPTGMEAALAAWASQATSTRAWAVGHLPANLPERRLIAIARPIYEGGALRGVVAATVDAERLAEALPVAPPARGAVALIDAQGLCILRWPSQPVSSLSGSQVRAQLVAQTLAGREAVGAYWAADGQERTVALAPVRSAGWAAEASRAKADVLSALVASPLASRWFLVLTVALAIGIGLATSHRFVAPLIRLREAAVAFGQGAHGHRAPVSGPTEMQDLAVAFNRMADEVAAREEQTARLLAEVQRRAAELDATIASMPNAVLVFDPSGAIVRMNGAAQAIFGYTPEAQRQPVPSRVATQRILHPDGHPYAPHELASTRALRGETVRGMVEILRSDQRDLWLVANAAPIYADDGELLGAVAVFTDITAQHELQEQHEDLLRMVSHDLRGPLTVVHGQAELLLRRLRLAGAAGRELRGAEAILASARRMNTMIQDLVDAARLENHQLRLDLKPLDLYPFVVSLAEQLWAADGERIKVEPAESLPPVLADADRLARVLGNLINNAIKYSPPGSPVTVRFAQAGSEVLTSVVDRGQGIAPEELPHLFQRYYRTRAARSQHEGLGLGLYITKMLVQAHGGRIWVESEPGKGSAFHFSLPAALGDPQPAQERP